MGLNVKGVTLVIVSCLNWLVSDPETKRKIINVFIEVLMMNRIY
jgi:hypothetical protein